MHLLGIDVGSTNLKVALVDGTRGAPRLVRSAAEPTPAPDALGRALARLIADVCSDVGAAAVEAVGVASMAETGVPLDGDGAPMGGWLRWDGARAGDQAAALAARLGRDELFAATGVRASGKVPLATWAWLREHEPERFAAMATWAGAADLVGRVLTGRTATDHTLAGRSMAYRLGGHVPPRSFDADLLAEVGLDATRVPEVLPPGTLMRLDAAGARISGLRVGTPLTIAGHDHLVAAWASGVRAPGEAADSLGTAEAVVRVLGAPVVLAAVARAGMSVVRTVSGAELALVAGTPSAGGLIAQWRRREQVDEATWRAAARLPGPSPVVVLPYPVGRQGPEPDPAARLEVIGDGGPVERARGLLDGVCLHARWIADAQTALAGSPVDRTVVIGGAALPAWLAVKAQVGPHPMAVVQAAEPVAAGAAALAGARAGLLDPGPLPTTAVPVPTSDTYASALARHVALAVGRSDAVDG